MMYDRELIITLILVFVIAFTYPFWYNVANAAIGNGLGVPEPVIAAGEEKECVESKAFMKTRHMDLLNDWRDAVVRDGHRVYRSPNGKKHEISLSNTCMKCHPNKTQFCDQCHDYMGVVPYCWECHIAPTEKN